MSRPQVWRVVEEMCDLDKQTLLGTYTPFGAHAVTIYSYLHMRMLIDEDHCVTDFGQEVIEEIKRDTHYNWVDKPCDTE